MGMSEDRSTGPYELEEFNGFQYMDFSPFRWRYELELKWAWSRMGSSCYIRGISISCVFFYGRKRSIFDGNILKALYQSRTTRVLSMCSPRYNNEGGGWAKHKRLYYAYHTCFSWACKRPKIMPLMAQTSVKHGFDNFNALGADELWGRSRKKPSLTRLVQFTSAFETVISSEKKRRACITSSNSAISIDRYVSSASYFSRCLYLSFYVIVCASIK